MAGRLIPGLPEVRRRLGPHISIAGGAAATPGARRLRHRRGARLRRLGDAANGRRRRLGRRPRRPRRPQGERRRAAGGSSDRRSGAWSPAREARGGEGGRPGLAPSRLRAPVRRILFPPRPILKERRDGERASGLRRALPRRAHRALFPAGRIGQDRGRGLGERPALHRSAGLSALPNRRWTTPASAIAPSRRTLAYWRDPTLRKGDAVMTPDGIVVFSGAGRSPHSRRDFTTLAAASMPNGRRADADGDGARQRPAAARQGPAADRRRGEAARRQVTRRRRDPFRRAAGLGGQLAGRRRAGPRRIVDGRQRRGLLVARRQKRYSWRATREAGPPWSRRSEREGCAKA